MVNATDGTIINILVRLLKETDRKKMLAYDKKQISRIHRILIPAVIFTAAVLLGRMDTIMADIGPV